MCDPVDDPHAYMRLAEESDMNIRYVIDTHVHADHVSTGRKLAALAEGTYVLHASAQTEYNFLGVNEGDVLDLGNVYIRVLHTPGHTPEHISLLVTDTTRGPDPWFLLSGHTLMVGDVGRTELAQELGLLGQQEVTVVHEPELRRSPLPRAIARLRHCGRSDRPNAGSRERSSCHRRTESPIRRAHPAS